MHHGAGVWPHSIDARVVFASFSCTNLFVHDDCAHSVHSMPSGRSEGG